jgi:hypothetical protein
LRFLVRAVLILLVAAIVISAAAHFAWKYSGSNQWEMVREGDGVAVYAMKTPGSTIEKFKAVWKMRSRLSQFVMWASDGEDDTEHSLHKELGFYDLKILEQDGERIAWSAWKQPLASFMQPREFVVKAEFSQDPATNVVLYTVTGVPDRIPPDDCCVRVPAMNNYWTLTPLKTGEIGVEWFVDMDFGGAVPYLLQNEVLPNSMLNFAPRLDQYLGQEKYKNARYTWIQDVQP